MTLEPAIYTHTQGLSRRWGTNPSPVKAPMALIGGRDEGLRTILSRSAANSTSSAPKVSMKAWTVPPDASRIRSANPPVGDGDHAVVGRAISGLGCSVSAGAEIGRSPTNRSDSGPEHRARCWFGQAGSTRARLARCCSVVRAITSHSASSRPVLVPQQRPHAAEMRRRTTPFARPGVPPNVRFATDPTAARRTLTTTLLVVLGDGRGLTTGRRRLPFTLGLNRSVHHP
jgi:hypothetical protein